MASAPGADANPYLAMAAVLGAALIGIEEALTPEAPVDGNGYEADVPQLPDQWSTAIGAFESGPMISRIFTEELRTVLVQLKQQELSRFLEQVSPFETSSYAQLV